MPLYMDIHTVDGASWDDVAKAHSADVDTQDKYDVEYIKYWYNKECGKLFFLGPVDIVIEPQLCGGEA